MKVNRRTTTVLAIIVVILIAVFAITRWQRAVATKKLLDDLRGNDYAKVMDAMTQLKERGHSIVPPLLEYLTFPRATARWRAATLLGDVGTRVALEPLTTALSDNSSNVRAAAALALGKLNAKDSAGALRGRLTDADEDIAARIAAAQALGLLKDRDSIRALQGILADRLEAQKAALAAAEKAAEDAQTAVETAQEALAEAEPDGVEAAQEAADAAKEAAEEAAQTASETVSKFPEARKALAADEAAGPPEPPATSEEGDEEAEEAEGEEAEAEAEEAAPELPTDTTWELRIACARALGMIGDEEASDALADATEDAKEPSAEVRTAAAYALGDIARRVHDASKVAPLVGRLLAALDDEVGDVRAAALHSLGLMTIPEQSEGRVEEALNSSLSDDFYWAREAARRTAKKLNIVVAE